MGKLRLAAGRLHHAEGSYGRFHSLPWSPGLVGSPPIGSLPPTLGWRGRSTVLGFVDHTKPVSESTIGLSGLFGELWIVPLLTGDLPGSSSARAMPMPVASIEMISNRGKPLIFLSLLT